VIAATGNMSFKTSRVKYYGWPKSRYGLGREGSNGVAAAGKNKRGWGKETGRGEESCWNE
jgi:hypothetical protein